MQFKWHPDDPPPLIEAHSEAKLRVLRSYLSAYFDRLNKNFAREEFKIDLVDGFSGGGTYRTTSGTVSGSPLVMLEEVKAAKERLNQRRKKPLQFDCQFYFFDVEKDHTNHLKRVIAEHGYCATDEKIVIRNLAFEDALEDTIQEISRRQPRAGRAIFLLDQTGYSQVPLHHAARIFEELPAAEIILTFAVDALINFLEPNSQMIKAVSPLELTESAIHDLIAMRDGDGGKALVQRTLRPHIRSVVGAHFDTPFFIRPQNSRRALWFLHLSRHPTARDVMIQRHWDLENTFEHFGPGHFDILGWDALKGESLPLFNFNELDAQDMRSRLPDSLARKAYSLALEQPMTVDAMRYALANETAAPFLDLDGAFITLFNENEIEIRTSDNKPRSKSIRKLNRTDLISIPKQQLLLGLSRRDGKT